MVARILINEVATDGDFSRSFLLKLSRMGASIIACPAPDYVPIDMDTQDGFNLIKDYKD